MATNAAGAAAFKYGTTRDWVRALTVVLPTGDVLDLELGVRGAQVGGDPASVGPLVVPAVPWERDGERLDRQAPIERCELLHRVQLPARRPHAPVQLREILAREERDIVTLTESEADEFLSQHPGLQRVPKAKREELKEAVYGALLAKTLPAPAVWDAVWDTRSGILTLASLSAKVVDQFEVLFKQTFEGLTLTPLYPYRACVPGANSQSYAPSICVLPPLKRRIFSRGR